MTDYSESEHPYGRRQYDNDLMAVVGRIDGTTAAIQGEVNRVHTRLDGVEARLAAVERSGDRQAGASQERSRWLAVAAKVGEKVIPAGGGLAGLLALWHAFGSQK